MSLNGKIILTGKGLHSGQDCKLTIEPCDSPEVLLRSGTNELPLRELSLSGTNRGSDYIFPDGTRVRTCEHVFSALAGLGIWSGVRVTVEGGEMPALDGCSRTVCGELRRYSDVASGSPTLTKGGFRGVIPHPASTCRDALRGNAGEDVNDLTLGPSPYAGEGSKTSPHNTPYAGKCVNSPVIVYGEATSRFITALPYDGLRITYMVEYEYIGAQIFDYVQSPKSYYEDISCARTFAMQRDIDYLRSHGMALGGSLDNAIVIGSTIQAKGGLHWPDEFVRHKVLDLIGDLAAVGKPVNAHIIAVKAGHELHLKLADKLRGA